MRQMKKIKLMEVLNKLLEGKLNEEIDIDLCDEPKDDKSEHDKTDESTKDDKRKPDKIDESTKDYKSEVDKVNNADEKDKIDTSKKITDKVEKDEKTEVNKMSDIKMFEDGWFDETSGNVDLGKIKNPEALAAIQLLTNKYKAEKEQRLISDTLNDTLKEYSLNVSEDTLRKVLDTSGVKIDKDGKVVGVKEAIEALKTSEPGFFKDKEKESNPLNEGFNPVEKKNTGNINSFSQAFKLMDEVNN